MVILRLAESSWGMAKAVSPPQSRISHRTSAWSSPEYPFHCCYWEIGEHKNAFELGEELWAGRAGSEEADLCRGSLQGQADNVAPQATSRCSGRIQR